MTEKTITVELDEKAARSLLRAEWRNDNDLGTDGWGAASDRAHDAIRAALTSSTGPDPENSSGVGEAVRHHLELAIEAKDRQASDDRIRAALSMLDHFAPVPQSGPVVGDWQHHKGEQG